MPVVRLVVVVALVFTTVACSRAYVAPDSGPRAKLSIVTHETRGTVGYMTPQECRNRLGTHVITDLSANAPALETYLPAGQDAVLAYDYDQPEHLGPVGPLTRCHVGFAFHPKENENYTLEVSGAEECSLSMHDSEGQAVPGLSFPTVRCDTLPAVLTPGFPPP